MRPHLAGPLVLAALAVGCGAATRDQPQRDRTWWYHGYPPHDEIRLRGEVSSVAVGFGKVWAIAADGASGRTRLVRIDPRREQVDGRLSLKRFAPPFAVGAGHVWILGVSACSKRASCAVVDAIDPKAFVPASRTVIRTPGYIVVRLLVADHDGLWLANEGDLAAYRPGPGMLWRVDPQTRKVVARVALPSAPLALAAGGSRIWITDSSGHLRAVDKRTNRLVKRAVALGRFPSAAVAAAGERVWAATPGALIEVDGQRMATVRRIRFPSPLRAEVSANGRWVWVSTVRGDVYRIDARTGRPGRPLRLTSHRGLLAEPGLLWTTREHAVVRIANWPGWDARPRAPQCTAAQLRASAFFQGATGSLAGGVKLRNVSARACTLAGFPRLRLTDERGRSLPVAVGHSRPRWEFSTAPGNWPYQTIAPGKSSGFDVWWSNWCGKPARLVFRVALPGGSRKAAWPTGPRCDAPGEPSGVTVSPYGGGFGS